MSFLVPPLRRAVAAAAGLTGRRFGLLVASSVVATSAIVASAMTNPAGPIGPLAALLGRSLASENAPVEPAPAPGPSQPASGPGQPSHSSGGGDQSTGGPPAPPAGESPEGGGPETEAPTNTGNEEAPSTPEAGRVKHVFVISLASPGYEASFGKEAAAEMPYLSETLRPTGTLLSKFTLLAETALPNGLAEIGGQAPNAKTRENCPKYDCLLAAQETTIADQLSAAGFTWHAYIGGMNDPLSGKPANCVYPGPGETLAPALGGYALWQNPFIYFHSLLDLGECSANDAPLTELPAALKSVKEIPNLSFIAPDLCDAGLTGQCPEGQPSGAAAADAFLAEWVPKIVETKTFKEDGLLVVTFDQVDQAAPTTGGPAPPDQVGTLLVSPFAAPGGTDAKAYGPYSVLRSFEELFGIEYFIGEAGGKRVPSFAGPLLGEEGSEG